ncbi:branched-chain amino acid ABC transporter permease [Micromonospora echinaurantiaca]|uniref:Amino acid/amide ABC transporter membrane protein 1, HAAT family n=1 Tax=Micromonospora echinaurantiaca TaxID=47857 RepID=A0A1C5H985_9ACTN|nr:MULTISPECIES: branched-chain amino acid ABC transporter permease [Micromonospora]PWU55687.1 branched-chain amino acid ABC transporter permease [Micromonospora sp. S4605]SCG42503.1 amino acid/amide ABC transporter membrane protein 1, HAAT family [Micromonospora echinaurantiaca]
MNFDDLFGHIGQHTVDGLSKGAIYALIALGYTLVYGVLRLINFAHSEVFMVGTFAVLGLWTAFGVENNPPIGQAVLFLVLGLIVAALASGGTALAIERIAYRPLRRKNAPPLIFLITAIGLSLVLVEVFGLVLPRLLGDLVPSMFARERIILGMPTIIEQKTLFTIAGTAITNIQLIVFVAAVVMMAVLDWFINRTRYGRGVRAVAQNPETAALMGVNQERVIMLIFVLGGIMAGAAALLWSMRFGFTQSSIGFVLGLKAFTAAVLGGIGNLRGALLGGLVLGIVEVYGATLFKSSWEDVIAFIVLIVVLMFRPTGLLGESLGRARA